MAKKPLTKRPEIATENRPKRGGDRTKPSAWEPTAEQKESARFLAATGATHRQIALYLGIGVSTVDTRLKDETEIGREMADLALVGKLYRKAMGSGLHSTDGDTACLIYLAKARLGMYDRPPVFGNVHPNDIPNTPQAASAEVHVSVRYRYPADPGSLPPPPRDRLPQTIEAEAKPA
jgi:hypothetical protein